MDLSCDAPPAEEWLSEEPEDRVDSRESIGRVYERCRPRVYRRCRQILNDDEAARDAVHDVFLKLLDLPESAVFRHESRVSAWLVAIATHHCLNIVRANRVRAREAMLDAVATVSGPRSQWSADKAECSQLVRQLLAQAGPEAAVVAVLYLRDGMTLREVGTTLQRSSPTVRRRLRAFLTQAEAELGERATVR
jgi:RNA polymerase sigma-70 factor (ECF subfamily)